MHRTVSEKHLMMSLIIRIYNLFQFEIEYTANVVENSVLVR